MEQAQIAGETMELPETTGENQWGATLWLPCELTLELPVPTFRLADLLALKARDLIDTGWSQTKDLPLRANGRLIAWTEFEVVGDKLAVRLTELA